MAHKCEAKLQCEIVYKAPLLLYGIDTYVWAAKDKRKTIADKSKTKNDN